MSSVRYIINTAPIEHINGKIAQVSNIVTNSPDGTDLYRQGYWYGFRRNGSKRSRFGIRQMRRSLVANPYTQAEDENRILFTMSLNVVYANKQIAPNWTLCVEEWRKQRVYLTQIGYAVHVVRGNNGEWPQRWTP